VRLQLDTHVFLRWLADDKRLTAGERAASRDPENDVYLSAASVWEIVIKQALGRLRTPEPASVAALRLGLQPLPITFEHAGATAALGPLHNDPFDRLPMAQAKVESLTLVSHDPAIRAYLGLAVLPSRLVLVRDEDSCPCVLAPREEPVTKEYTDARLTPDPSVVNSRLDV
jgi:PIN domain nuclease of toxin-antitoxin system